MAKIRYRILAVNDDSADRTEKIVRDLARGNAAVRCVSSDPPNGFGLAVRRGLADLQGDTLQVWHR